MGVGATVDDVGDIDDVGAIDDVGSIDEASVGFLLLTSQSNIPLVFTKNRV